MVLDNFRTIELIWDKANKSIIKTVKTASSDTTGRYLSVKILDGGQEVTLNGASLQLYWEHPNFNTRGMDNFDTVNNGGLFRMTFSQELLTNIGELDAYLVLTLSNGKITSDQFPIKVIKGADNGVVVPTNGNGLVEQINNKIDKGNVTMDDLTTDVKLAMTGGSVAIVGENSVGTENIKDNSVTPNKIDSTVDKINYFDKSDVYEGQFYTEATIGNPVYLTAYSPTSVWAGSKNKIQVKAGDVVRFNQAFNTGYFIGVDDDNIFRFRAPSVAKGEPATIIVPEGVTGFYSAVLKEYLDTTMITVNKEMPTDYVAYGVVETKKLEWVLISEENLDDDLKEKVTGQHTNESDWEGKTLITAGDSITWQDGRVYSGTTDIARGWQTVVKERLKLASVKNIAVSGRPMADGTSNGDGTVTTVLLETTFPEDVFGIASATNDHKLNVAIGELRDVGSAFDRNTFYGAYQTTIEYILSKRKDIRIVLFTPLHRNNGGYNSTTTVNAAGHKLIDYVEAIKAIGARYSVPVCDMYSNSGINMLTLDADTRDGLHPNDVGYTKMGNYASKFINNI